MKRLLIIVFLLAFLRVVFFAAVYEVKQNDTLWGIAKRFDLKSSDLSRINDIIDNRLISGQLLVIPEKIIDYTVQEGDNLTVIAKRQNTKLEYIILLNNLPSENIYPGMIIRLPVVENKGNEIKEEFVQKRSDNSASLSGNKSVYRVKKGDNLTSIARRFGTKKDVLISLNKMKDEKLYIGEKIRLPGYNIPSRQSSEEFLTEKPQELDKIDLNLPSMEDGFSFPVNKKLIKNINTTKRGITIRLSSPTEVKSINNGVVEYAGKMNGYNNIVIVRYGNNKRAVYGFLCQVMVTRGNVVNSGQVIGNVDYISFLKQIELYFEMRKGTESVDLMELYPFLRKDDLLAKK